MIWCDDANTHESTSMLTWYAHSCATHIRLIADWDFRFKIQESLDLQLYWSEVKWTVLHGTLCRFIVMLDAVMHKNKRKQNSELPIFKMNRKSPKYQKP